MPSASTNVSKLGKRRLAASLAAGALFALAAPPTNVYPALWLGMACLAALIAVVAAAPAPDSGDIVGDERGRRRLRRWFAGAGLGLAFGLGANVVALRFVPDTIARFTPLPWAAGALALVLLSAAQGLRWALAAGVAVQLARRGVPRWLSFGAGVYASTFFPAVFPWTPAGGVTPWPAMVQLAELVGERGVTLLMAFAAGLLGQAALEFRAGSTPGVGERAAATPKIARRAGIGNALAACALVLLTVAEGKVRIARVEKDRDAAPRVQVALVQPGTGPTERWDPDRAESILLRLTNLTRTGEAQGAELTVWPEAAYPIPVAHGSRYCPGGAKAILPMGVRGPVLTGLIMTGAGGDLWNSAALCHPNGTMSRPYDKIRLLAFGETIPVIASIPWVRRTFSRGTALVAGDANVVQASGPVRASVLNCFEDTLPDAGRDAMADRPNLLVNVTNDAWFAGSAESELHLRLAALRAVESRRDLVRAVNLGPTSWVDAAGVVRARYESPLPGVLLASPALLEWSPTPFDRTGDAPAAVLLVAAIAFARTKSKGHRHRGVP